MTLTPRVKEGVARHFAGPDRDAVMEMLPTYSGGSPEGDERIHLLILRLSRRSVDRVRKLLEIARRDYRDLIAMESNPTRTYIVGLLRPGPNAPAGDKTTLNLNSLRRWKTAGAIAIGGLCVDDGDVKGFYIFTVESVEAAQDLVRTDPGVQSGMLAFEFHEWLTADGLRVGVPKDFLDV
jgi:hypothetical protein